MWDRLSLVLGTGRHLEYQQWGRGVLQLSVRPEAVHGAGAGGGVCSHLRSHGTV